MDLRANIQSLKAQLERVDRSIAKLEGLRGKGDGTAPRRKGGRKSMGREERRQVAERMRRYWAQRREQQEKST